MFVFAVVLFGASAAAAATMTVDRIQRGEYLTAAITFGGAVFAFGITVVAVRGRFISVPLRTPVDSAGTLLLPDLVGMWVVGIVFFSAVPTGLLYVIFVPQGVVDLPLSRGQEIFSPILIGALVVFSAVGLIAMARRRGTGHLRFDSAGFEIVDVLFARRGSWDDVTDITDQWTDKDIRHPIVFVMNDAKPIVIKNASGFVPNGAALYWMVRHYWLHPENRDELTDGRALERLRNEQFVVE